MPTALQGKALSFHKKLTPCSKICLSWCPNHTVYIYACYGAQKCGRDFVCCVYVTLVQIRL